MKGQIRNPITAVVLAILCLPALQATAGASHGSSRWDTAWHVAATLSVLFPLACCGSCIGGTSSHESWAAE